MGCKCPHCNADMSLSPCDGEFKGWHYHFVEAAGIHRLATMVGVTLRLCARCGRASAIAVQIAFDEDGNGKELVTRARESGSEAAR